MVPRTEDRTLNFYFWSFKRSECGEWTEANLEDVDWGISTEEMDKKQSTQEKEFGGKCRSLEMLRRCFIRLKWEIVATLPFGLISGLKKVFFMSYWNKINKSTI